jgi:hypothetical protein
MEDSAQPKLQHIEASRKRPFSRHITQNAIMENNPKTDRTIKITAWIIIVLSTLSLLGMLVYYFLWSILGKTHGLLDNI